MALRQRVSALANGTGKVFVAPLPRHSGDNAAMIAFAAHISKQAG
jgi:tRNA A37 threonylcarbamoyltransferase TsaD